MGGFIALAVILETAVATFLLGALLGVALLGRSGIVGEGRNILRMGFTDAGNAASAVPARSRMVADHADLRCSYISWGGVRWLCGVSLRGLCGVSLRGLCGGVSLRLCFLRSLVAVRVVGLGGLSSSRPRVLLRVAEGEEGREGDGRFH